MTFIDNVLNFWFPEPNKYQKYWFDHSRDEEIKTNYEKDVIKYGEMVEERNELCKTLSGKLCCIILLDQFTRNLGIIKYDEIAFNIAKEIITNNEDLLLDRIEYRLFILLPYRHQKKSRLLYIVLEKLNSYITEFKNNLLIKLFYKNTLISFTKLQDEVEVYSVDDYPLTVKFDTECCKNYVCDMNDNFDLVYTTNNIVYKHVKQFIIKHNIKDVCISLSGGVDSMVLSYVMTELLKNKVIDDLIAVHLNYGNRKIADEETKMVIKWCSYMNIPLIYRKIKHMTRNNTEREFYESETKNIRFELYKIAINELGFDSVFLGHHNNDIDENIFMNILKKKLITDLDGMKEYSVINEIPICRPMLSINKNEIYELAYRTRIPYTLDTTPKQSQRGLLRNSVLHVLYNDLGLTNQLSDLVKQIHTLNSVINDNVLKPILESIIYKSNGCVISNINNLSEYIFENILIKVFNVLNLKMIKQKHLKYIFNRINKKYDKDILINFGNIIGCLTTDNKLYIYKKCKWTVDIIPYDEQVETLQTVTYLDALNDKFSVAIDGNIKKCMKHTIKCSLLKAFLPAIDHTNKLKFIYTYIIY